MSLISAVHSPVASAIPALVQSDVSADLVVPEAVEVPTAVDLDLITAV